MSRLDEKQDVNIMEEKFFSKEFYFSYSGLNKLIYSPKVWYRHYVLNEREDRTDSHLIDGKVIHALLLDESNFNKNFAILPGDIPTSNTRIVVDKVYKESTELQEKPKLDLLQEYKPLILKVLLEMNLHQKLKTDDQRIDKIVSEQTISYWKYLTEKGDKDIIDQEIYDRCKVSAELLKADPRIVDLLKLGNTNKKITVYNEEKLARAGFSDLPFGIKGIVDNIVVDDEAKIVYVNDVKTTGKTIEDFHETVEYYNYWIQAIIYLMLAKTINPNNYPVIFTFIVIDKFQQVYPFEVSKKTIADWIQRTEELLQKAKWHYTNKKFKLPYKFETETVTL